MISLKQARDMFRVQREAKKVKKELKNIHVEAEASGVKVVMSADQEIVSIEIADFVKREDIPELMKDALNRVAKKVQIISAEKMQPVMEGMGLQTGQ